MPTTLDQLIRQRTKEEILAQMFLGLQGIGRVVKTGFGYGLVTADGVAAGNYAVRAKVVTEGSLNSGQVQVSTDGGLSYGATTTIPANGRLAVGSTGLTLVFSAAINAPTTGNAFEVGDTFAIDVATPTFPTGSWNVGSFQRTLLEQDALVDEDFAETIKNIAAGAHVLLAPEGWVDLAGEQLYLLERNKGSNTVGNVVLTDAANSGPHTIAVGQLWVGTATGLRYLNITGGTLPLGGTLTLSFKAEKPGTLYNAGAGTITRLFTSLAGVTVNNPNPVGGSWMTLSGADRETKLAYAQRCILQWATLAMAPVKNAYEAWAKKASNNIVTRVYPRASLTVEGLTQLYLASAGGGVSGSTIALVSDYITPRMPLNVTLQVLSASAVSIAVNATLYAKAGYGATVLAAAEQNLTALFSGGVNSNGEELPGIPIGGTVYLNDIIEQLQIPTGLRNAVVTAPTADTVLTATQVPTLAGTRTVQEV